MVLNPFKHGKGGLDLFGRDEPGEYMVLKEVVGGRALLFLLIDKTCVLEMRHMCYETLFGNFPSYSLYPPTSGLVRPA